MLQVEAPSASTDHIDERRRTVLGRTLHLGHHAVDHGSDQTGMRDAPDSLTGFAVHLPSSLEEFAKYEWSSELSDVDVEFHFTRIVSDMIAREANSDVTAGNELTSWICSYFTELDDSSATSLETAKLIDRSDLFFMHWIDCVIPNENNSESDKSAELADPLEGYEQFQEPNWDSEGAEPITAETRDYAKLLLEVMPVVFGAPDIAPSADGSIDLEWHPADGHVRKLFLDIGPGKKWRAYWTDRDGEFGRFSSEGFTDQTEHELRDLFDKLSG